MAQPGRVLASAKARIRKWSNEAGPSARTGAASVAVFSAPNLDAAHRLEQELALAEPIFILLDPADAERCPALSVQELLRVIVIRADSSDLSPPLASLLGPLQVCGSECELFALDKVLLRRAVQSFAEIRCLDSEGDLDLYFRLRYETWRALGYLDASLDCAASNWEVNYTDQSAQALGAFERNARIPTLIGCIRLVHDRDVLDSSQGALVRDMVQRCPDKKVGECYERPPTMVHPFDVLASFPAFGGLYRTWVRQRLHKAEVSRVIVRENYRRRGLGEVLVDSAIDMARRDHMHIVFLACRKEHAHFYERSGFTVIDDVVCDRFVGVNVPAIAMQRRLTHGVPESPA